MTVLRSIADALPRWVHVGLVVARSDAGWSFRYPNLSCGAERKRIVDLAAWIEASPRNAVLVGALIDELEAAPARPLAS
jgi:hypothetical protein